MNTLKRKSFQETCWREKIREERLNGGFTVETYRHSATVAFEAEPSLFEGKKLSSDGQRRMVIALRKLVTLQHPFDRPRPEAVALASVIRTAESADSVQGFVSFQYETGASFYDGD